MAGDDQSDLGRATTLGLELAAGIGLGVLVGLWVDRKFHTDPWGVIIGSALGFVSGMYLLIKVALRSDKK